MLPRVPGSVKLMMYADLTGNRENYGIKSP